MEKWKSDEETGTAEQEPDQVTSEEQNYRETVRWVRSYIVGTRFLSLRALPLHRMTTRLPVSDTSQPVKYAKLPSDDWLW